LTEKGYGVGVVEAGARFADSDFADTSWDVKRFLFRPEIGCYGIQRIDALKDCVIVSGAGVGGGSLVYANTLYEPLPAFYTDRQWAHMTDWKAELAPYYDQAKRMLFQRKGEDEYESFLRQIRSEAYVEIRLPGAAAPNAAPKAGAS